MSYRIKPDENLETAIRRIAASQLGKAIAALENPGDAPEQAFHTARKHCKKLRALVRLVRPVFSGYGCENKSFRDAARQLSGVRDGAALVETVEKLIERQRGEAGDFRGVLKRLRGECTEKLRHLPAADGALDLLREARTRCESWEVEAEGFDAIGKGLRKTYRRARRGYRDCRRDPAPERLHDWRKRVKYHGYHVRLLGALWSPMSDGQQAGLRDLASTLGAHHDLENLRKWLDDAKWAPRDRKVAAKLQLLAQERMQELTEDALASGCVLFALKPKDLMALFGRWWKAAVD